jgi:predicted nucleic acid-binding Zn ribbon protein
MPVYTYKCDNGHEMDDLRKEVERNDPFVCLLCKAEGDDAMMVRAGIELQKRPFVVGGSCIVYKS